MDNLFNDPLLHVLQVLLVALVVEAVMPWPERFHPLSIFRIVAKNLALRVNPKQQRADSQRFIAGILAPIILVAPLLICLVLFRALLAVPEIFDLIMLTAALSYAPVLNQTNKLKQHLFKENKALAKDCLKPIVLRDTSSLSEMGLIKAGIESQVLRFSHQYLTVILVFLFAGSIAAVCYRLCYEMAQQWNPKIAHNRVFAKPVAGLVNLLKIPAALMLSALFSLMSGFKQVKSKSRYFSFVINAYLSSASAVLKHNLAGPAIYDGEKVRRDAFKPGREPELADIVHATKLIRSLQSFIGLFVIGLLALLIVLK